jgi:SAM-dependent methyltransferase
VARARRRAGAGEGRDSKVYGEAEFRRFYLDPETRVMRPAERRRRVAAVVAAAERWLDRPLRTVLDVGCGLGLWGREIRRLRPTASYVGYEPSPVVERVLKRGFEIRRGSFAEVEALAEDRSFDLVLCVDLLHYLSSREVDVALDALVARATGPLALEVMTSAEEVEGDVEGWRARRPDWWRRRFESRGLVAVGLQLWLPSRLAANLTALERFR